MEYKIVRSKRKTISLVVKKDCTVEVRAPYRVSESRLKEFVTQKKDWINNAIKHQSSTLHMSDIPQHMFDSIKDKTTEKVNEFVKNFQGTKPLKLSVKKQKTIWGSCNSDGKIYINAYASVLPDPLFDYVMVHELCHLIYLDHSREFWKLVEKYIPDWKKRKEALKKYNI